jgi:hypothetical protein
MRSWLSKGFSRTEFRFPATACHQSRVFLRLKLSPLICRLRPATFGSNPAVLSSLTYRRGGCAGPEGTQVLNKPPQIRKTEDKVAELLPAGLGFRDARKQSQPR